MLNYHEIIDKYYESGSPLREILILHSKQVADKAKSLCRSSNLQLSEEDIEAAAMLHDIGICRTHAPKIHCHGDAPYIQHGIIGANMLRVEGCPEWLARVCERHTGAGLTVDDIRTQRLPLPEKDYLPESTIEKLICYADKFFSKSGDMAEKSYDEVYRSMLSHGADTLKRFEQLHDLFANE